MKEVDGVNNIIIGVIVVIIIRSEEENVAGSSAERCDFGSNSLEAVGPQDLDDVRDEVAEVFTAQ